MRTMALGLLILLGATGCGDASAGATGETPTASGTPTRPSVANTSFSCMKQGNKPVTESDGVTGREG